MAASGSSKKKKDGPNMVHWNQMFADRIRHEQEAADEWQMKWGLDPKRAQNEAKLSQTIVQTPMHSYLEQTNAPSSIIQNQLGTKKEAIDSTLARQLHPCTYHLVGKSIQVTGVDPTKKYKFPLTTSQEVGWHANNMKNIDMAFSEGRRLNKDKVFSQ